MYEMSEENNISIKKRNKIEFKVARFQFELHFIGLVHLSYCSIHAFIDKKTKIA